MKYVIIIVITLLPIHSIFAQSNTIAGATEITLLSQSFTNVIASGSEALGDGCLGSSRRTWFKFHTNNATTISISLDPVGGWGGFLYVSLNQLDAQGASDLSTEDYPCNDNGKLSLSAAASTYYYLAVHRTTSDEFNITITSSEPLPVELTNFTANLIEDKILLNWVTATEINNYGFEIERSSFQTNGTTPVRTEWETIGFVEGHGNSNSPKTYSFVDDNLPSGLQSTDELEYRLKQIDTDGAFKYYNTTTKVNLSSITSINSSNLPIEFSLGQNYPNPFNPSTAISYSIAAPSLVQLSIFDLQGKKITSLVSEFQETGNYKINYNASILSSGIYFYELKAINEQNNIMFRDNKKMILIK